MYWLRDLKDQGVAHSGLTQASAILTRLSTWQKATSSCLPFWKHCQSSSRIHLASQGEGMSHIWGLG